MVQGGGPLYIHICRRSLAARPDTWRVKGLRFRVAREARGLLSVVDSGCWVLS